MNDVTCDSVLSAHFDYMRSREVCRVVGDRLHLTSPFSYGNGDAIDVFVRPQFDGSLIVSDMGATIAYMRSVGFDPFQSERTRFLLSRVMVQNRASVDKDAGVISTQIRESDKLGRSVNDIVAACIAASDLLFLSRATSPVIITDDVSAILEDIGIPYEPNIAVVGEVTGKAFRMDFRIENGQGVPGYIKTVSPATTSGRTQATNAAFRMWYELPSAGLRVTIIDDRYSEWLASDLEILRQRSTVLPWLTGVGEFRQTVESFWVERPARSRVLNATG